MIRITAIAALLLATPAAAQDAAEPPQLEHAFTIIAEIGEAVDVGRTGRGIRRFIPITGGTVEGEDISGTVLPGAWDWQLDRPDGCTELVADYFIETDEGAVINVVNQATLCPPAEGEARQPAFTRPVFEPPLGEHEWMGRSVFVGRLEMAQDHPVPAVRIAVFEVK
jgi:hypothetical protein